MIKMQVLVDLEDVCRWKLPCSSLTADLVTLVVPKVRTGLQDLENLSRVHGKRDFAEYVQLTMISLIDMEQLYEMESSCCLEAEPVKVVITEGSLLATNM